MTLKPVPELLAAAQDGRYAVGYFESWNLESLQGVLDAAEKTRSPVIVGFNGEFLTLSNRRAPERLELYAALGRAAAEAAKVPCGFIFNECPLESAVRSAVLAGFNLVMLSNPGEALDVFTERLANLVKYAHSHGVAVEAELGELPNAAGGSIDSSHSALTDPGQASRFVEATQVDVLSVSAGNVHVLLGNPQDLDLALIGEIGRRVKIPLSLHGGTGISLKSLQAAIHLGIAKVNFGSYLKRAYLNAQRQTLSSGEGDPHKLLGMGGAEDVMVASRLAVRDAVLERLDILGCCGRA
jgi:ketose-bisphosphate aldolase